MLQDLFVKTPNLHVRIHKPAAQQRDTRLRLAFHRQVIGNLSQMTRLPLQYSNHNPNPVDDLFAILDWHQFFHLFAQLVVQFLTTAHLRPPLVVKQPNYAVFGEQ
jgi:hypothetical protein